MTALITVVDPGSGNLFSVCRALEHVGAVAQVTTDPARVRAADRLVLPGVGAFGHVMGALEGAGLVEAVKEFAATGRPFLGICVGMQAMLERGEEFGHHAGLSFVPGVVRPIPQHGAGGRPHRIPHIGWDGIFPPAAGDWKGTILDGVETGSAVYFVHSFAAEPAEASFTVAACDYNGLELTAVIRRDNLWGCQFHPEKSGPVGLGILRNFVERT